MSLMTEEDVLRFNFEKLMRHNELSVDIYPDGSYTSKLVNSCWVSFKSGARAMKEIFESEKVPA